MSHQFDVYHNPSRRGRQDRPFLLDIQHPSLSELRTRVVVPLVVAKAMQIFPRLMPALPVAGRTLYLSPTEPMSLPLQFLGEPVANLAGARDAIVAALDLVFTGI